MSFIGIRLGKRLGLPVIHTEHGSDHVKGVPPAIYYASRIVDRSMGRYVIRHASRVLSISKAVQDFVKSLGQVDSLLFYNAISTDAFRVDALDSIRPVPKLVFLGRLVDGKGWETCLRVGEALASKFPDLEVHFVGDGAQRYLLEAAVKISPIRKIVRIHGYLLRDQIKDILSNGVLLNPTTLAEGFQTTLLEAVTAGAAVVSTPVSAAQFLADSGAPVLIVSDTSWRAWVDACEVALTTPRKVIGPELISQYDWSTRSKEFMQIVDTVVEKHTKAGLRSAETRH